MKSFKKIVLAIMLLCSINALSAEITLIGVNGNGEKVETLDAAIDKITKENNKFIKFNVMPGENIGYDGVKNLAKALTNPNCKLAHLEISVNRIGAEGTQYIADALKNEICNLRYLNIGFNSIGNKGAQYISEALKNKNCKLAYLEISSNKIGAEGAQYIADALMNKNCSLSYLKIGWNEEISDKGTECLAKALLNSKLTKLNIGKNKIGPEGARYIADALKNENCNLTELYLYWNKIGDDGAKAIAKALLKSKLTNLNLGDNEIGPEGAQDLANALMNENCKLTELDLDVNSIGDDGAKALSEALKNENCKLTKSNLRDNRIGIEHLRSINFTMELCAINNLKRMVENEEININNYIRIIEFVGSTLFFVKNLSNETMINWYNSLQNKELPYLDAEYKEELDNHGIENSDAAVKYIQNKFNYSYIIIFIFFF
ncbi:hypothetical protein L6269_00260, partial [Candidatus Dependentiae bacterium]|nr:hypothetical protein [Candidatus Dependentiae bacterium]